MPKNIEIHSTSEFNLKSPFENGKTSTEHSLINSKYLSKKTGLICSADYSGFEIDYLDKDPGVYSARWGGKYGDFSRAIRKVYRELSKKDKNWKNKKIKARFVCALTIYGPNQKMINSVGKIEGHISPFIKGENGFGYDPIFIPQGKKITFSEMKPSQKFKIDHRYKAFKKIKKFF